jgi:hypothetical protein
MECYERDFEEHLLADTADYYRRSAAQWITQDSCPAYMIKVSRRGVVWRGGVVWWAACPPARHHARPWSPCALACLASPTSPSRPQLVSALCRSRHSSSLPLAPHPTAAAFAPTAPADPHPTPSSHLKAEECLAKEEERVDGFLHTSTKAKLLREVENEVLSKHQQELLQKEHSGCAVLLRDDKVGGWLSRPAGGRRRCRDMALLARGCAGSTAALRRGLPAREGAAGCARAGRRRARALGAAGSGCPSPANSEQAASLEGGGAGPSCCHLLRPPPHPTPPTSPPPWPAFPPAHTSPLATQTEDLSRMFRLFHRIANGLNPVADMFRKHVEDEGNKLVGETAEAMEAKKDKEAGGCGWLACRLAVCACVGGGGSGCGAGAAWLAWLAWLPVRWASAVGECRSVSCVALLAALSPPEGVHWCRGGRSRPGPRLPHVAGAAGASDAAGQS